MKYGKFRLIILSLILSDNIFSIDYDAKKIIAEIKRYEKEIKGKIGIKATFIKNEVNFAYNEKLPFPMASTRKLPIAAKFLLMCESKLIDINECIQLKDSDWRPGSGILHERVVFGHMKLSLKDIFQLMLEESDNVATDIITKKTNGPKAVTNWLKKLDINNLRLDRNSLELKADYDCVKKTNIDEISDKNVYESLQNKVSQKDLNLARKNFLSDLQDTSSPNAMVNFLKRIVNGEIINDESYDLLLKHLRLNEKSDNRISKLLPLNVLVGHKGGTLGEDYYSITNDVAIITLPENNGVIIMSIFIKSNKSKRERREEIIAKLSLDIFNYLIK